MNKSRMSLILNGFGASSIECRGLATAHWLESMEMSTMSLLYNGFVNKINENVKMSLLYNGFVNKSMKMSKMSLILNGFVNKIDEQVKNVIDFKWFCCFKH